MSERDSATVRDTVSHYGRYIDDRDWAALASILDDALRFDFTSLWGGEPEMVTGTDLVARWRVTERWIINGLMLQVAWVDGNQAVIASAP